MALFNRQKNIQALPQEVQDYYHAEKRGRVGVAWLLSLATLILTFVIAAVLFFGGRWVYRTVFNKNDNKQTGSSQLESLTSEQSKNNQDSTSDSTKNSSDTDSERGTDDTSSSSSDSRSTGSSSGTNSGSNSNTPTTKPTVTPSTGPNELIDTGPGDENW